MRKIENERGRACGLFFNAFNARAAFTGYDCAKARSFRLRRIFRFYGGVLNMWAVYALCSAFFAALTSILAKVGIEGVNSNLATAVRTAVVLVMAWLVVFATGTADGVWSIGRRSWLFLVLSGACDGRVVALLLQGAANRRGLEGHPRGQIQRRPRHHHGLHIPSRSRHGEDAHRRRADSDRDVRADSVNLRQASDFAVVVSKMEITTCR